MILGDRLQLQQVIINLVLNAIEAMQPVSDRPRELVVRSGLDETTQVLVSVTNCGIGIAAEDADLLFKCLHHQIQRHGMGLSISRSIIEAHDGLLWATANVPHAPRFSSPCR